MLTCFFHKFSQSLPKNFGALRGVHTAAFSCFKMWPIHEQPKTYLNPFCEKSFLRDCKLTYTAFFRAVSFIPFLTRASFDFRNYLFKNPRPAWYPTQCNMEWAHTVCRCCCNTDECNGPRLPCLQGEW